MSIGKDLEVKEGTVWDLTIRVHRAELGLAYNVYFIQSQHTTGLVVSYDGKRHYRALAKMF